MKDTNSTQASVPLLSVRGVTAVHTVSRVSFDINPHETLALIGESGAGKSTLARTLFQQPRPLEGHVIFRGRDLTCLYGRDLTECRREMQMIFQDPRSALDPTWTVERLVEEPLAGYRLGNARQRRHRVAEVLERVGLPVVTYGRRRPRELSGGQCQRVAIARALAPSPALIVYDEAVASLDPLIQANVLGLLEELRSELGLSGLFISHDLLTVHRISDRVAVMYAGELCEIGPTQRLYRRPLHPYTAALLAWIPRPGAPQPDRQEISDFIEGEPLSSAAASKGCRFRARCPRARERCGEEVPILRATVTDHVVACHFPL